MSLAALHSNAARFGQRLSETISESTRDLSGLSPGLNGGSFDVLSTEEKMAQVKKQLDSNSEREKLDALKKLLGTLSKPAELTSGQHSAFFPLVVKNVASTSLEVRKLVYIYLLRFAHLEPDLALLSINTFQKDLSDPNPLIRAMALRLLSGIGSKVYVIQGVVQLAVKKCAADPSPYVRKSAALSLIKCYEADPSSNSVFPVLTTLLADRSPLSLGAIAMSALVVAPSSYQLYHKHYRRYCAALPDIDSWGQCYMLQLLGRYARENLRQPASEKDQDADITLLLDACKPLFFSQNPATILAAVRLFRALAPVDQANESTVQPLLRLLHSEIPIRRVVLSYVLSLVLEDPKAWVSHVSSFILRAHDNAIIKSLKLKILMALQTSANIRFLEREFSHYSDDPNAEIAQVAVRALGICAMRGEDGSEAEKILLRLADSEDVSEAKTAAVVSVLMAIITHLQAHAEPKQRNKARRIVTKLAKAYLAERLQSPQARSRTLWVAGTYAELQDGEIEDWAPDVLRIAARSFPHEAVSVKLQTIGLASKLAVITLPTSRFYDHVQKLASYLLILAKREPSIEIRDRTRFFEALLLGAGIVTFPQRTERATWEDLEDPTPSVGELGGVKLRREQVRMVLLKGIRSVPLETKDERQFPAATFGSLSSVLDRDQTSTELGSDSGISERFPGWCTIPTEPSVRAVELPSSIQAAPVPQALSSSSAAPRFVSSTSVSGTGTPLSPSPAGSVGRPRGNFKDLDAFYASSDESEGETASEADEEEGGSEEEEEEGAGPDPESESEGSGSEDQPALPSNSAAAGAKQLDEFYEL